MAREIDETTRIHQTHTVAPRPQAEFLSCRARLQRLHDAKMLSGWVDQISRNHCAVRINEQILVTLGESYYVEIHGPHAMMTFKCTCSGIEGLEMAVLGQYSSTSELAAALDSVFTLDLFLMGQPNFLPTSRECRKNVGGLTALMTVGTDQSDVRIQDVSLDGAGFVSGVRLPIGQIVRLDVVSTNRTASVYGEVKNCRELGGSMFRVGIALAPLDRIQSVVWKQICQ